MICLGIDIGSSNIKGGVLDLDKRMVHSLEREAFPAPLGGLPPGYFEIPPDQILTATRQVIRRLLNNAPTASALFFSGQMGGTILVDERGLPLTNYLSWRDQRTLAPCDGTSSLLDIIRDRWSERYLPEVGNELQPGSTSSLLFWLRQNGALPSRGIPASVADFVVAQLCRTAPQMDVTHTIGLLDLARGTFHHAALAAIELGDVRWPQLAEPTRPVGHTDIDGKTLACFASYGDQQCALRGAGLQLGELSLNISTGSQVSRLSEAFEPGPYQSRRYLNGLFLKTLTHLPAGRSVNVLIDLLTELARAEGVELRSVWKYLSAQAEQATGGGLEASLAFFSGPLGSSGHISGITTENLTVGNLFQACFQSMADNFARCALELSPQRDWEGVALSGGMTRSLPTLHRLIAERFSGPLRESQATEETLSGLLEIARSVLLPNVQAQQTEDKVQAAIPAIPGR